MNRLLKFVGLILMLCLFAPTVYAEISSTNYRIKSTVLSGGGGSMSSESYSLVATLGQSSPIGTSTSSSFRIEPGFWNTLLLSIIGDVNGDGIVDLEDMISALQVATGQTPSIIVKQADADGDGLIGLGEAIMILRNLGGL